ncbi:glutamate receptor 1 isoform X2 [Vespula squamosa]|uniref:Glutamate receptor 1 isoform X2 n=1 Tax=Vespula squamosa TaxID=30214 RepID=A0ABD2AGD0_VESSQ
MLPVLRETDGPFSAPRSRRRRRVRATTRSNPRRRGTASLSSSFSSSISSFSSFSFSSSSSFDFRELLERKDAENEVEDEEIVRGRSGGGRASGVVRPVGTSTLMTTALTLLLILLPAAFPDKINIASWITINAGFRVVAPELAGNERKGEREEQKMKNRLVKSRKRRRGDRGRAVDEGEERKTEARDEKTLNVDVDGEGNIRSRIMEQYHFAIVFVALRMRICGPATRFIATHLVL